ncbi:MAG TPA: UbiX family flavin prenyltransferase [Phycisphaerales bacterium]|nr:UbiX family flavin prenyltransferase [Phycisphaerales bacterium]HIB51385.1 UbiX family flavin prenyltransferase [Phycisphaerales bacterium]HIN83860.1 UbiX family flavin prenyltransferase [Phycisphaerales bacterium]HIO20052.1 UbiX family flavin prenyltransferase [Phycisphaerales bacterium]HIO52498.1 UbiX family flavin prenyltransferase [Phycisphaerales bacterium]
MTHKKIVVGVTGASGAPYFIKVLRLLLEADVEVHLTVSSLGKRLLFEESNITSIDADGLGVSKHANNLIIYGDKNLGATIASGSFLHDGMLVLPCSSNTLGAIGSGVTNTLVQRAAAVTLKERRRLVLAHRESPISLIDIQNMRKITEAGGIIAPLSPGFYMQPTSIDDLIDFVAGKLVDLLDVEHNMPVRWNSTV